MFCLSYFKQLPVMQALLALHREGGIGRTEFLPQCHLWQNLNTDLKGSNPRSEVLSGTQQQKALHIRRHFVILKSL